MSEVGNLFGTGQRIYLIDIPGLGDPTLDFQ